MWDRHFTWGTRETDMDLMSGDDVVDLAAALPLHRVMAFQSWTFFWRVRTAMKMGIVSTAEA